MCQAAIIAIEKNKAGKDGVAGRGINSGYYFDME